MTAGTTLARGVGLFSLGLGIYQLVAPRDFLGMIGVRSHGDTEATTRAVGARELGAAAGLLARRMPVPFMWFRVAGDVVDLALLSRARHSREGRHDRIGTAIASVAGITALDVLGSVLVTREAQQNSHGKGHGALESGSTTIRPAADLDGASQGRQVVTSITVNRPPAELYAFWRKLGNLPRFMSHLESVEEIDDRRSRWVAKAPFGMNVEWEAEIVDEVPGERISWRSVEGSQVHNAGSVRFEPAPAGRGTKLTAELSYDPPGGPLGVAIARLSGEEPEQQASDGLRRFKQIIETGEVVQSEATYGDRKVRQRPAQPVEPTTAA